MWAAALAAIITAALTEGCAGMKALLRRLGQWRVGGRWFAFALLARPTIMLVLNIGCIWATIPPGIACADR